MARTVPEPAWMLACWEATLVSLLGMGTVRWAFLFDEIHHRGQLSTSLRPIGGKAPSSCGPSADDPGQQRSCPPVRR